MNNIIDCTVDENGDVLYLATEANDRFLKQPDSVTRRASHVEPVQRFARICFYILRWFGNKNRIAQWTRNWHVLWRVNTKPVGGPILTYGDIEPRYRGFDVGGKVVTWHQRQQAIDAEIKFLNDWFLERGIQ